MHTSAACHYQHRNFIQALHTSFLIDFGPCVAARADPEAETAGPAVSRYAIARSKTGGRARRAGRHGGGGRGRGRGGGRESGWALAGRWLVSLGPDIAAPDMTCPDTIKAVSSDSIHSRSYMLSELYAFRQIGSVTKR
jgi:hypothetical protein